MRTAFTFIMLLLLTATSFGQLPKKAMKKMGQNPIVFLDSMETEMSALKTLNPFDILNIGIVKPKKAKKLLGDKGVDGAIYVTTVKETKLIIGNISVQSLTSINIFSIRPKRTPLFNIC